MITVRKKRNLSSCDISDILILFMSWMINLGVMCFQRSKLYPPYSLNVSSLYLKLGKLYIGQERPSVAISALKKVTLTAETWPGSELDNSEHYWVKSYVPSGIGGPLPRYTSYRKELRCYLAKLVCFVLNLLSQMWNVVKTQAAIQ